MQVHDIPIGELIAYDKNAKIHSDKQNREIANSLLRFGWKQPLVVDRNNVLIVGHGRLEGAKIASLTDSRFLTAPCIIADDLTDEEIKAYRLADNKLNESPWDFDLLDEELRDITGIDMSDFGFDMSEFEEEPAEVVEDDYNEKIPEEPKSKLGDIYQLGQHRLMCGDSTDTAVIDKLMDGVKADMVFTDPPYNVGFNGRSGKFDVIKNDDLDENDFRDLITASCNIIRTLNPKEYYIWCNWKFYGILQEQLDYKSCIVWAKNVFGMGKGYRHQHEFCLFNGTIDEDINNESDLWEIAKDVNYVHPTQKPVALCARALKNHKGAEVIVDLFGGSGSTMIACEQLDRSCYMMELDPRYVDVIIDRWEKFTGQKAVKLN